MNFTDSLDKSGLAYDFKFDFSIGDYVAPNVEFLTAMSRSVPV